MNRRGILATLIVISVFLAAGIAYLLYKENVAEPILSDSLPVYSHEAAQEVVNINNEAMKISFSEQDHVKALAVLDKAIAMDPKYKMPHANKGVIYVSNKQYGEAVECYKELIRLDPRAPDSYLVIGAIMKRLDRKKEANEYLLKALAALNLRLRKQPADRNAQLTKCLVYSLLDWKDKAKSGLNQLISSSSKDGYIRVSASTMLKKIESGEEIDFFD